MQCRANDLRGESCGAPHFFRPAVIAVSLLGLSAVPVHAEQFTACLDKQGRISQLQKGDRPLNGQCRGQREEIKIASARTLNISVDKTPSLERTLVEEIGPFRIYASCTEQGMAEPPAFISIESDETIWVSSDTTSGAAADSTIPPGNFGRATANFFGYEGAPFLLGAFPRTWVSETGVVLHTSIAMMLELTQDCSFFGEIQVEHIGSEAIQ